VANAGILMSADICDVYTGEHWKTLGEGNKNNIIGADTPRRQYVLLKKMQK